MTVTTEPRSGRTADPSGPPGGAGARPGPARRLSSWLHRHRLARLAALLSAPMLWLIVAYLGALAVLLLSALWTVNDFTSQEVHQLSLANFKTIFTTAVYRNV